MHDMAHSQHSHSQAHATMDHSAHGGAAGHRAHVDHTGHEQMFRRRFWVSLALSIPVLLYSPALQDCWDSACRLFQAAGGSRYRKMVQNLAWAAGYNVVALPLAAGVLAPVGILLSPAVGALLMSLSTIIVALNAQLLRRHRLGV